MAQVYQYDFIIRKDGTERPVSIIGYYIPTVNFAYDYFADLEDWDKEFISSSVRKKSYKEHSDMLYFGYLRFNDVPHRNYNHKYIKEDTKVEKKKRGRRPGQKHSEEAKKKISESRKKWVAEHKEEFHNAIKSRFGSDEHKQKLREMRLGKKWSDEMKKKMSESHKGHIVTEETREKIRKAHLGVKRDPEVVRRIQETRKKKREAGLYAAHYNKKPKNAL